MSLTKKIGYFIVLGITLLFISRHGGTWFYLHSILGYQLSVRWVYVFVLAVLLALLLTPITIWLGKKYKILDYPDSRKIHNWPIVRIGGVAVFLSFLIVMLRNFKFSPQLLGIITGTGIIFIVGLIDDIRGLSASIRFGAQLLASAIVIYFGSTISFVPPGPFKLPLEILITLMWLIGITNAFNFLDGMDGLACGLGMIYAALFSAITWTSGQDYVVYLASALAGACLGFLPYNFRPAKVFLGDCGSTTIGFLLAAIALAGSWAENNHIVALTTPLLILAVPIFDMIYTTISRVRNGSVKTIKEWLEFTGKDHLHHRLNKLGFNRTRTVLLIYSISFTFGLNAILIRKTGDLSGAIIVLMQTVIGLMLLVTLMLIGRTIDGEPVLTPTSKSEKDL